MGRHVAGEMPALDRLVDDACAEIGREIDALCIPRLAGVVLGGGYGRGEGGVREKLESKVGESRDGFHSPTPTLNSNSNLQLETPTLTLSNDLDFFAITEDGAPEAETVAAIGTALKPMSEKWTAKLGVDVDFTVKTPWRIRHDQERLMIQELLRGYCDVTGKRGEELFSGIAKIDAANLPWMEAARLMMNRGMGLLFAKCRIESVECKIGGSSAVESRLSDRDRDFVVRNINKCILGAGDARLIARHAYTWRAEDRANALGDALYSAAVEWKFRPSEAPVCEWDKAREVWLAALDEVSSASCPGRSVRQAVRWLVRRHTIGDLRTFGMDCTVRVLKSVARRVRERRAPGDALLRDWQIFN